MKTTPITKSRLELESLDGRVMPATITFNAGVVRITGDALTDAATVTQLPGEIVPQIKVTVKSTVPASSLSFTQTKFYQATEVLRVVFVGGAGNDRFENSTSEVANAYGDSGNDILIGGSGNDYLNGGDGNDTLVGRGGHDTMHAGNGNDFMYGDLGNDVLLGTSGDDYLNGGAGNDQLHGANGNDRLYGLEGVDVLNGGAGNDVLHGGQDHAADLLIGGLGADKFKSEMRLVFNPPSQPVFKNIELFMDRSSAQGDTVI
jgi:Ca2+-binding RTX toxin-like protein